MIRHLLRGCRYAAFITVTVVAVAGQQIVALAQNADLGTLKSTREHPLFSPTRRAVERRSTPTSEAVAASAMQPTKPNLELRGVVFAEDRRIAIVKHPQDGRAIEVSVGNQIDGWTIVEIQRRAIALHRDTSDLVLKMSEPK